MSRDATYYKVLIPIGSAIIFAGVAGYFYYKLFDKEEDVNKTEENASFVSITKIELKIPPTAVGAIIGRNGSCIKKVQELTSTAIHFRDEENGERICVIKGKLEKAIEAKEKILKVLQTLPIIQEETIHVPDKMVGKIVGRDGRNISKLRRDTGAFIRIPMAFAEHSTGFVEPNDSRKVLIKGTRDQIDAAKNAIFEMVEEDEKLRREIKNSASKISRRSQRCYQNGEITNDIDYNSSDCEETECLKSCSEFNEVYVSAVDTAAHFWVQLVGPKTVQLDKLVSKMSEYYENLQYRELHELETYELDQLVAAKFSDGMWYRGKIINPEDDNQNTISVFFVDFGDTEDVEREFVCDLRTDFLTLSYQAVECYLGDVDIKSAEGEAATEAFENLSHAAKWKPLMVRVMGYRKGEIAFIPYVKVIDKNGPEEIDIGEELIKRGLVRRSKYSSTIIESEDDPLDTLDNISDLDDIGIE